MIDILYEFLVVKFESGKRKIYCQKVVVIHLLPNQHCSRKPSKYALLWRKYYLLSFPSLSCYTVVFYPKLQSNGFFFMVIVPFPVFLLHFTRSARYTTHVYPHGINTLYFFGLTSSKIFIKECTFLQFFSRFQDIEVPSDMTNQSERDPGTPSGKNNKHRTTTKHRKTKD